MTSEVLTGEKFYQPDISSVSIKNSRFTASDIHEIIKIGNFYNYVTSTAGEGAYFEKNFFLQDSLITKSGVAPLNSSENDTTFSPHENSGYTTPKSKSNCDNLNDSCNDSQKASSKPEAAFLNNLELLMRNEIYTSGEIAPSETFVEETMKANETEQVVKWLLKFQLDNYDNPSLLIGLLHMISHFEYNSETELMNYIPLSLLQHKNEEVCEFSIKVYENWNCKSTLKVLKSLKCDKPSQQKYLDEVIEDIETSE